MSSHGCYPEEAPKLETLLHVLSDTIRRELIYYFEKVAPDEMATVDAVATHLEGRIPSVEQTELRRSLHHTHLPKLEENGWVEYDRRTDTIRYHGHERPGELLRELANVFDR